MRLTFKLLIPLLLLSSCYQSKLEFDAAGTFEAREILISSEQSGKVLEFRFEEGQQVNLGDTIAVIDDEALRLQELQVLARLASLQSKLAEAYPQILVLRNQKEVAKANLSALNTQVEVLAKERNRIKTLFESEAATEQQFDELDGKLKILNQNVISAEKQIEVIDAQISAAKQNTNLQNRAILSEVEPIEAQLDLIRNQISRTIIISPAEGTLLTKYIEAGEIAIMGKPLAMIADLELIELRSFVSGDQLSSISIDQDVNVYIDKNEKEYYQYPGTISWISDKAEFTPKSIQTKNERSNLVYACKVRVKNDGKIKIGMYGELSFNNSNETNE